VRIKKTFYIWPESRLRSTAGLVSDVERLAAEMSAYQAGLASQDDLVAARRADLERELRSDPRCGPGTQPTKKQNPGSRISKISRALRLDLGLFYSKS
jgi:hypothetical protein